MADDILTRLRAHISLCNMTGEAPCVRCMAADEIEQLRTKLTQADQRLDRALEQMDIARDNAAWWRNLYNRLLARTVTADD